MSGRCTIHHFEPAIDVCGLCLHDFCRDCVVYSFGRTRLPYCMACAVQAAGVRGASPRRPSRRERKQALARRAELAPVPA